MKDIVLSISNRTRAVTLNSDVLGVVGENLQGRFYIDFNGEFIDGACFLLCEMPNGESGYIAMEKDTRKKVYFAPIKSSLLTVAGYISLQVKITKASVDDEIPIFKSQVFKMTVESAVEVQAVIPDTYPDWEAVANAKLAEMDKAISDLEDVKGKSFIKAFTKVDFKQVGTAQRYFISIKKAEHGLENPYVDKVLVNRSIDSEETTNFQTAVSVGEKTLSTGTIKIYVTIDLSKYTEYSGRIYLKGE